MTRQDVGKRGMQPRLNQLTLSKVLRARTSAESRGLVRLYFAVLFPILLTALRDRQYLLIVDCIACVLLFCYLIAMSASQVAAELSRRHPLQRFEAPGKGLSGVIHVRLDRLSCLRCCLIDDM